MPYINQTQRALLKLATLEEIADKVDDPGTLNYVISYIITKRFQSNKRYATANMLLGVLEAAKMEFYREHVAPYEETKKLETGSVLEQESAKEWLI